MIFIPGIRKYPEWCKENNMFFGTEDELISHMKKVYATDNITIGYRNNTKVVYLQNPFGIEDNEMLIEIGAIFEAYHTCMKEIDSYLKLE